MADSKLAEVNEKLRTLLRGITPRQYEWLQDLQRHPFNPSDPEQDAWALVVQALMTGIRSSTARLLIEDRLRANGIEFSAQKMNAKAFAAKAHWENLGTTKHPESPPLELSAGSQDTGAATPP